MRYADARTTMIRCRNDKPDQAAFRSRFLPLYEQKSTGMRFTLVVQQTA